MFFVVETGGLLDSAALLCVATDEEKSVSGFSHVEFYAAIAYML